MGAAPVCTHKALMGFLAAQRVSATAATFQAAMPAELEDGSQPPASLPAQPASLAAAPTQSPRAAAPHHTPRHDSPAPLQPAKRQRQGHQSAAAKGSPPSPSADAHSPAHEPAASAPGMVNAQDRQHEQPSASASAHGQPPPAATCNSPDTEVLATSEHSSPAKHAGSIAEIHAGPTGWLLNTCSPACPHPETGQEHQQQQPQQHPQAKPHPGRPPGRASPSDSSSDGTHEGAFPALHPIAAVPHPQPHPQTEPTAACTGPNHQLPQPAAQLEDALGRRRVLVLERAMHRAEASKRAASPARAQSHSAIAVSDGGASGQQAPRVAAQARALPQAEGSAHQGAGAKRASARLSSSSSFGLTQAEKALRRKAKQATGAVGIKASPASIHGCCWFADVARAHACMQSVCSQDRANAEYSCLHKESCNVVCGPCSFGIRHVHLQCLSACAFACSIEDGVDQPRQ